MRISNLVLLTLALCMQVAQAAPAHKNPGQGQTLEFYALTTGVSVNLSNPPQPGEMAIFARDLYELGGSYEAPVPVGDPIGRNVVLCTIAIFPEAICEGRYVLYGRGLMTGSAYLNLVVGDIGFPRASLTGGSGEFAGVQGAVTTFSVGNTEDQVWIIEISGYNQP